MEIKEFKELFSDSVNANGFLLTDNDNVFVFRVPLQIWNAETGDTVEFNSIDDFLNYEYEGKLIRDRIAEMDELRISVASGSTGSGDEKEFKFNHAGGNSSDKTEDLFPAYANVRIKSKTLESAMKEFHERFGEADREWAYEVDEQGYVHQFKKGNATSVAISGTSKNNMILHNHPGGGAFSDSDLISTALGNQKGIVAASKEDGMFIFEKKGGHFKATEFIKAIKTAKIKGKDYNDAVDKWLKANQKKYGYSYKWVKPSK